MDFSIVIPAKNEEQGLVLVLPELRERYPRAEIIVVDDGSTDNTAEIINARKEDIHTIYQDNAGPSVARNRGIAAASGQYIAFLDVDDLWPQEKLAFQVNYLEENPALEVLMGGIQYVLLDGARPTDTPFDDPNDVRAFVNLGAGLFRREAFERIGLFAEDLRYSEDVDWFFRAMEQDIKLRLIKTPGLLYRRHDINMTRLAGDVAMRMNFLKVVRRSMLRRRQPDGTMRRLPDWAQYYDDEFRKYIDENFVKKQKVPDDKSS